MLFDIIYKTNLFDLLVLVILIRIVFIGIKNGFLIEIFKLLGLFFGIFITFHYYVILGNFVVMAVPIELDTARAVAFVVLLSSVVLFFKFFRDAVMLIFKVEPHPIFNQWGGLLTSVVRALLVCSLFFVFCQISGHKLLVDYGKNSVFGAFLFDLSPKVYQASYDTFVGKFFPGEKINQTIVSLKQKDSKAQTGSNKAP